MLSRVRRRRAGVHRRPAVALSQCARTVLAMCWLGPFAGGREVVPDPVDGLLEREVVTASAGELVGRVAAGGTAALFVIGEAGLGQTSVFYNARPPGGPGGFKGGGGWRPPPGDRFAIWFINPGVGNLRRGGPA